MKRTHFILLSSLVFFLSSCFPCKPAPRRMQPPHYRHINYHPNRAHMPHGYGRPKSHGGGRYYNHR